MPRRRTAAEEASIRILRQEAEAERVERLAESLASRDAEVRQVMEGDVNYEPHVLTNWGDQWERTELARINERRPPWRICTRLPTRCYDASLCNRYLPDEHK